MSEQEDRSQLREEIAQEKFGKSFEECDMSEKQSVGGTIGGRRGGEIRKQQMMEEGGVDEETGKMKAYSEMGQSGAKKGGYATEFAHDPALKEKFTGDAHYGEAPEDSKPGGGSVSTGM